MPHRLIRFLWMAALFAVACGLPLTLTLVGCDGGGGANSGGDPANRNGGPATPFEQRLAAATADYLTDDPAARQRAATFMADHAQQAVPRLIEWAGSDPWLTASLRAALAQPADSGATVALQLATEIRAPEMLDAIAELAISQRLSEEATETAKAHVVAWGEPGLDALRRAAGNNKQQQRAADQIVHQFPRRLLVRYWSRYLTSDRQDERDAATQWLTQLTPGSHYMDRGMVLELLDAFRSHAPQTIRAAGDTQLRALEAQMTILKRLMIYRPAAGDDPWYVPAFARAVAHCQDFTTVPLMPALVTHVTNIRRENFVTRLAAWLAERAPDPSKLDASAGPDWIGLRYLGNLIQTANDQFDRTFRQAGTMRPDTVRGPSGEEVRYPADRDPEFVTESNGTEFRAAAMPPLEPLPEPPGLPAANDAATLEKLAAWSGGKAAEWVQSLAIVLDGEMIADGDGVDLAQQYAAERWNSLAGWVVSLSPVVRALADCGDTATPALVAALADAGEGKADWRQRATALLALALQGKLAAARAALWPAGGGKRELRGTFEWLTFCVAMLLDPATLTEPDAGALAAAGETADVPAALCAALLAPPTLTAVAPDPGAVPGSRYAGSLADAWLYPAFAAALLRQAIVTRPAFFETGESGDSAAAWLAAGTAATDKPSAIQAAILEALLLNLDHDPAAFGGSDRLLALLNSLPTGRRSAVVQRIRWARHRWALPGIQALLTDSADPPVDLLDALTAYGTAQAVPVMARYVTHSDPAVRLRAVRVLPPTAEWLPALQAALDDADARVVSAAAQQLLYAPEDSGLRQTAATRLWATDPGKLLAQLHLLPESDALQWLGRALDDPDRLLDAANGVEAFGNWLLANRPGDASADARRQIVALLEPKVSDPAWGNTVQRARMLHFAGVLANDAARALARTACMSSNENLVKVGLDILLAGDATSLQDADVPAVAHVLGNGAAMPQPMQYVCAWIAMQPAALARTPLVDALLPYLQKRQERNLQLAAGAALVARTPSMLQPVDPPIDPRIAPAIRRARDAEIIPTITGEYVRFMFEDRDSLRWLLTIFATGTDDEANAISVYLRATYYRRPEVRTAFRDVVWPDGGLPASYRAGVIRSAWVIAWPGQVVDAAWVDALLQYDPAQIDGAPPTGDPDVLPRELVEVLLTLVMGHEMPIPDSARNSEAAAKDWMAKHLGRLSQWKAWWKPRRDRILAAANAAYEAKLAENRQE